MSDSGHEDQLLRFLLDRSALRGVAVRLDATWQRILASADYPGPVLQLLGECCAASALLTGHLKLDGRLSIQFSGEGVLRTLFADCSSDGELRGLAHWREPLPASTGMNALFERSLLAITIENRPRPDAEPQRYQGLVDLEADSLAAALEGYFERSEQIDTAIVLAADGERAAGIALQRLPGHDTDADADGWRRGRSLLATATPEELLRLPMEQLLFRLFHEDGARVLAREPLRFGCSCSRERVEAMLVALGREEALAAAADGEAEITCEFCNTRYRFGAIEIAELFTGPLERSATRH